METLMSGDALVCGDALRCHQVPGSHSIILAPIRAVEQPCPGDSRDPPAPPRMLEALLQSPLGRIALGQRNM